ncbi:RrF2 family transcriptional regulator [Xanthomarina spongicola]|uniref:BadM/Rrf2 family transcriptional regulator n=1 Tax=Xanthomarina spongicola TaxID=570520 RepID=A0A316DRW9_9FLAO|nr:Rrf2 family transcriptional regulator [Xanthomarina spongicola]PWK20754.1 BadM/Rrf2 family transcriptional regulator [Xanthomarina spongicola]
MLSNACQYAIRSILYLGMRSDEEHKIGVKVISKELEVPQPFLAKLLQQLNKSNLVTSTKGPYGGFYLSETNKQHTVWDIVSLIDGNEKFNQCFLGLSKCGDDNPCPVHFTVSAFKQKLFQDFKEKTIAEFVEEIKLKGRYISLKSFEILKPDSDS